jgi:hypothetical protein
VPLAAAGTLLRSDGTPAGDHRVERDLQAISSATGLDRRGLVAFSHRMRDLFEQAERRAPAGVEAAAALCLAAHAQGEPMLSAAGVLDAVGRVELAEVLARAGLHGLAEAARWTRAGTP